MKIVNLQCAGQQHGWIDLLHLTFVDLTMNEGHIDGVLANDEAWDDLKVAMRERRRLRILYDEAQDVAEFEHVITEYTVKLTPECPISLTLHKPIPFTPRRF